MAVKTFENSMAELENIVAKLEAGDVSLDDSLKLFEEGIKLAKNCQKKLDDAEAKVKILTKTDGDEMVAENFGGIE